MIVVPVDQILARDGRDGGVFGYAGIGALGTVAELSGLTPNDFIDVIVAPGDGVGHALLRDLQLVRTELRIAQQVEKDFKNVLEVSLQTGQANASGVQTAAGFDLGRVSFQEIIQLVPGLGFDATRAPDFTVNIHKPGFGARLLTRSSTNAREAVN